MTEASRHLRRGSPWVAGLSFYGPWDRFLRCAEEVTAARLQDSYLALFGGTPRTTVPLYESAYLDQAGTASGWLLAQLENDYAAAGLRLRSPQREAPDHAAVELEFVSFLSGEEAEAWETENMGEALRALRRQRSFLEQHPRQWFGALTRAVAARADSGLYRPAVEAALSLVAHDADFLGALAARVEAAEADVE